MVVTVILSVCPVGDTGIFLPISAVDEFSHRSSREFRCLSKAIKPEIFNTDMFLFLLEKSPWPFNSPWRLPLSNGCSFYRQKGSLPLKAAFLESPRAHGIISICFASSELWSHGFSSWCWERHLFGASWEPCLPGAHWSLPSHCRAISHQASLIPRRQGLSVSHRANRTC